jgi:hypothetical protein
VSYTRRTTGDDYELKAAHCSNIACTEATLSTLESSIGWSIHTSITIGADGLGLISYYDAAQDALRIAHCINPVCSSATLSTIEEGAAEVSWTTTGADGLGLVAYWVEESPNEDIVKVAHCSNAACTASTSTSVASGIPGGVTIGPDGLALVSYGGHDPTLGVGFLGVAHCADVECASADDNVVDTADNVGALPAITTGTDGFGLISYVVDDQFSAVRVAHCDDIECSSATVSPVAGGRFSEYTSVAIGADGLGIISYADENGPAVGTLRTAHCSTMDCTSMSLTTVDPEDDRGAHSSTAIGVDGFPLIAYHAENDVNIAHCSNVFCVPYFRRR